MSKIDIVPLTWDSEYFGILCAKIVMKTECTEDEFEDALLNCKLYRFLSINNINNNIKNNLLIGTHTSAFLVDLNVQFMKRVQFKEATNSSIVMCSKVEYNLLKETIKIVMNSFKYSKFICDEKLYRMGGSSIYEKWILNSMSQKNKYLANSFLDKELVGMCLFSINHEKKQAIIELISTKDGYRGRGVARNMLMSVEAEIFNRGIETLHIGTQVNNLEALNLYHSYGFKEIGNSSIYHLWRN